MAHSDWHVHPLSWVGNLTTGLNTRFAATLFLLIASVCNGIFAITLVLTPPATGYEPSIYAAYPTVVWAVFVLGLVASLALIIQSAVAGTRSWILGLVFVCSLYVLFLLLPLFRGWAMYGRDSADALAHIGITKIILETGSVPAVDWYPIIHILLAELSHLGLPLRAASPVLSALFTPVYILSMVLLGRQLFSNQTAGILVAAWSIPLFYGEFHHSLHPWFFSFLLIPTIIALVIAATNQRDPVPYGVLLVVLAGNLLYFHPITSVYAVMILGVSVIVRRGYAQVTQLHLRYAPESILGVFLTIGWFAWYLQFEQIRNYFWRVVGGVSSGSGGSETVASNYGSSQLQGVQSVEQLLTGFITNYGPQFVVAAIAGFSALNIIVTTVRQRQHSIEETWLTSQFTVGGVVTLIGIFVYIVASNPIRNARYLLLFAAVLSGFVLYRTISQTRAFSFGSNTAIRAVIVVLLLSTTGLAVMTSYQHNYHMTYAEEHGTDWYYAHRSDDVVGVSADVTYKMRMYSEGGDYGESTFREFGSEISPVERRFGYQTHSTVGAGVNGFETYIVTKEHDILAPTQLHPSIRAENTPYRQQDLRRLRTDASVSRLYSNGGYTVWYVEPTE